MNITGMDLNLLLVFEALVEERSVTRAASRIGLSQPAMSNALTRLRRTFDDPIMTRTGGAMVPTPTALALIAPVRGALAQLRQAFEEKRSFDPSSSLRSFNILTSDYAEIMLLSRALAALHREAESASWTVHRPSFLFEPPSAQQLSNSYDLAIGFYPNLLALERQIHSHELWEERNVCLVSNTHPAIRNRITLRQFVEAGHVAPFYRLEGQGVVDSLLAQQGYTRKMVLKSPHFATIPHVVANSDLIATVPERFGLQCRNYLPVKVLPLPIDLPPFRFAMLWHQRHHSDPAHEWLRNGIIREAARIQSETR